MPLQLQSATETDAERAAQIEKDAYGVDPFVSSILFPGPFPEPPVGQKNTRTEELTKIIREDPSVRWFKVIDTDMEPTEDNRQMIGFAQWNINDGLQQPAKPRTFGPGANVEACEEVSRILQAVQNARLGVKFVHIRLLHVEPKHQRRGAGRMLVMWGIEEAKKLGLPIFLESSEAGLPLYLSCGFREIDTVVIDFTKWGYPANRITHVMSLEQ